MSDETDLKTQARHAILKRIAELAPGMNSAGSVHSLAEAYASVVSPGRSTISVDATAKR